MRMRRILPSILLLVLAWSPCGCRSAKKVEVDRPVEETMQAATAALREGRHRRARTLLRKVAAEKPPSPSSAEAAFLVGESYYRQRRYGKALAAYRKYVQEHPISEHLATAESRIFEIAVLYLEGKIRSFLGLIAHRGRGVDALEFLLESFPRGTRAPDAQRLLADRHFRAGRWEAAALEYRELLQRFPDSEWRPLAQFRLGMCYYRQIRGAAYALVHLEPTGNRMIRRSAREEFARYVRDHPEGPHVEEARSAIARIDEMSAEKAYHIGRFYDRADRPGTANEYYEETATLYPGTRFGERSRRLLERRRGGTPPRDAREESP